MCGDDCGVLPNDAQVTLRSAVVIVPKVEGTTVPAAAVRTAPDGRTFVVTDAGEVDVTVRGSGQGVTVVEGIEPGARVQVTGQGAGMGQPGGGAPPAPAPGGGSGEESGPGDGSGSTQDG